MKDKFEKFNVGDEAQIEHLITSKDIRDFVELTGDDNRIHVDAAFAKSTAMRSPIAHGMLGASFLSAVIGTKLPGDGAVWFSQNLEFLLPARIGDKLTIRVEILKKIDRQKILELQTDIFNQHGQKVTTGTAKVKVVDPASEEDPIVYPSVSKNALVIGATGGIGQEVCRELAARGYTIAIHYHKNKAAALELQKALSAHPNIQAFVFQADIQDENSASALMNDAAGRMGGIGALVNCATVQVPNRKFLDLKWEEFQSHFDINVKGSFFLLRKAVPLMAEQRYGRVVQLTTQYTEGAPAPELIPYITAKSALNGFARALAVEVGPLGITVNLVSPGMTETPLIANVPERTRLTTEARTPVRRLGKPKDVASAVAYLVSEDAGYVNGETIRINGGQVML